MSEDLVLDLEEIDDEPVPAATERLKKRTESVAATRLMGNKKRKNDDVADDRDEREEESENKQAEREELEEEQEEQAEQAEQREEREEQAEREEDKEDDRDDAFARFGAKFGESSAEENIADPKKYDSDDNVPAVSESEIPDSAATDAKLFAYDLVYYHAHKKNQVIPCNYDTKPVAKFRMLKENEKDPAKKAGLDKIWARYENLLRGVSRNSSGVSRSTSNAWPAVLDPAPPVKHMSSFLQQFIKGEAEEVEEGEEDEEEGQEGRHERAPTKQAGGNLSKQPVGSEEEEEENEAANDEYEEDGFVVADVDDDADQNAGNNAAEFDYEKMEITELQRALGHVVSERDKLMKKYARRAQRLQRELERKCEPLDEQEALIDLVIARKK